MKFKLINFALFLFVINASAQLKSTMKDSIEKIIVKPHLNMKQVCYLWKMDVHNCHDVRGFLFGHLSLLIGLSKKEVVDLLGKSDFEEEVRGEINLTYYNVSDEYCKTGRKRKIKEYDIVGVFTLVFENDRLVKMYELIN